MSYTNKWNGNGERGCYWKKIDDEVKNNNNEKTQKNKKKKQEKKNENKVLE